MKGVFVPFQRSATGQGETHEKVFNQQDVSNGRTHRIYILMYYIQQVEG